MKRTLATLAFFVALTLGNAALFAQQTNVGNITGTVEDASGAIVPGAEVSAVNQGTNSTRTAVTSDAGVYYISLLPVGTYTITVTKTGFQKATKQDAQVISGQTLTANISLQVGATTQTITVTGTTTAINTTDTNQGTTRTLEELQNLPINMLGNAARAAVSSVQTLSGVNYNLKGNSGQAWMVVSRARINGIDGYGVGYEIDGVASGPGEPEQGEDFIAPVPEAIQEVRLTNNTDSSQGFSAGQSIAMISKSGTNDFHGVVYYYNRNDALDARAWFLPNRYVNKNNQGGWTFGGPIVKNKTFFFATMDVFRYVTTSATTQNALAIASVPTLPQRTGDFRDTLGAQLTANGTPVFDALNRPVFQNEIYDPATTRSVTQGVVDPVTGLTATSSGFIRDPFAFGGNLNVIDPARLSSVSNFWADTYSAPNGPGVANNWTGEYGKNLVPKQQWSFKLDQAIGDNMHFMFSAENQFGWGFPKLPTGEQLGVGCHGAHVRFSPSQLYVNEVGSAGASADCRHQYRYRVAYTWTVTPNVLLSFRAGITRDGKRNEILIPQSASTGGCDSGLAGSQYLSCWTPRINIQDISPIGNSDGYVIHSQRTPVTVDMNWTKGKHLYAFGANYLSTPFVYGQFPTSAGVYNFTRQETGLPGTSFANSVGWGGASLMLGEVASSTMGYPQDGRLNTSNIALYGQDKWRVTSKLTVTYGLRWEVAPPAHEHQNKISTFDPSKPNPAAGGHLGAISFYGQGAGRNGLEQVGAYYFGALGPKLGLAYAHNEKTVFRANYGISYFPYWGKWLSSTGSIMPQDGFAKTLNPQTLDGGLTPAFNWDNAYPQSFPASFPLIDSTIANGTSPLFVETHDNRPPMMINMGAELERQLPNKILLRLAYVGSIGHRMYAYYNLNQYPLSYFSLGQLLNANINSPAVVAAGFTPPYPGFNGSLAQALRPYPQYNTINNFGAQRGNSNYQSFQINVQRHFGGLTFLANATFAKLLNQSDTGCACAPVNGSSLRLQPQSIYDPSQAKALAPTDLAKQMNISWIWELPVGRGKRFLGNSSKAADYVFGNWRVSAIQSYQGGFPIVLGPANLIGGQPIKAINSCGDYNPSVAGQDRYLNPAAFQAAPPFTLANTNVLPSTRGCGYINEDFGIDKAIPINERWRFSFGAFFTNAFNRHQFIALTTNVTSSAFGKFNDTSYPRTIQLYGRVTF